MTSGEGSKDVNLRERLATLGGLREEANMRKAEAVRLTTEALQEVQKTDGVSMTEAARLLGITRDTAYKALKKAEL